MGKREARKQGAKSQARSVLRQVTVKMRGLKELTEKEKAERSKGTVRMAMQQKYRRAEGHETVAGGQKEESEWVMGEQRRESEWVNLKQ